MMMMMIVDNYNININNNKYIKYYFYINNIKYFL